MGKYTTKLIKFDNVRFDFDDDEDPNDPDIYINRIDSEEDLVYALATWAFDCDFRCDEASWAMLDKVRIHFGKRVRDSVLYNLFHRGHDT